MESGGEVVPFGRATWAHWDQRGRLVYSRGGKLFASRVTGTKGQGLDTLELADFTHDKPTRLVAPDRATRW